jgi:hypothetical protein
MRKIICKQCSSDNLLITERLNPNDDNTIREYFTDAYASDGGTCFCCDCGDIQEFKVLDTDVYDDKSDPWRCAVCGSLDVEVKVWVGSNTGEITDEENIEDNDRYCNRCEANTRQVQESELMNNIDYWFEHGLKPDDDEIISGLNSDDYDSEEEYTVACKELWNARDNESKIHIWHELTRDKSNDN